MIGFSLETCIGVLFSLLLVLFVAPAGVKSTSKQIISLQVAYGAGFLSLCFGLLNVLIYTWLYEDGVLAFKFTEKLLTIWASIVSTLIGAFYWIILCRFFIEGVKTKSGRWCLILWPFYAIFQDNLPALYIVVVNEYPLFALRDSTTDWITTGLVLFVEVILVYAYWVNRYRWETL